MLPTPTDQININLSVKGVRKVERHINMTNSDNNYEQQKTFFPLSRVS